MVEAMAHFNEVQTVIRGLFKPIHFIGSADLAAGSFVDFEVHVFFLAQIQDLVDQKIQALLRKREIFPLEIPRFLQDIKRTVKAGLSLHSIVDVQSQEDKVLENSQRKFLQACFRFFTHLWDFLDVYEHREGEVPPLRGFFQYTSTLTEQDIKEMQADMLSNVKTGEQVKLFMTFFSGYERFQKLRMKKKVKLLLKFLPIDPSNMESFIRSCSPDFGGDCLRFNCEQFKDVVKIFIEELEKP